MRTLLTVFGALALVLAACSSDDDAANATTTTSTATSSTSEPAISSTSTSTPPEGGSSAPELASSCTSPDGFTVRYPDDWDAVADCGQFGPAPVEEPAPASDERAGVVGAYVDQVAFGDVSTPDERETARASTTVDGLQAVRVRATTSGQGLYPAGADVVRWMVDLSTGTDDGAGTLFLDAIDVRDDVDFARAVVVLDAMARSLDVTAGDQPQTEQVVARFEGGGTPFTVAAAPAASNPSTCLRLVDADGAIACVEAVDAPAAVAVTGLDAPAGPITVGIAGPDVWAVDIETDQVTLTYLPVPYPARDSLAFAVPVAPDDITAITLRSIDGTVLAEVPPADARRPAG